LQEDLDDANSKLEDNTENNESVSNKLSDRKISSDGKGLFSPRNSWLNTDIFNLAENIKSFGNIILNEDGKITHESLDW